MVVMFESGIDVLRGPDIIGSIFEAPQDINENRHAQI